MPESFCFGEKVSLMHNTMRGKFEHSVSKVSATVSAPGHSSIGRFAYKPTRGQSVRGLVSSGLQI